MYRSIYVDMEEEGLSVGEKELEGREASSSLSVSDMTISSKGCSSRRGGLGVAKYKEVNPCLLAASSLLSPRW